MIRLPLLVQCLEIVLWTGHLYQLSSNLTPSRIRSEKSLRRGFIVTFSFNEREV